MIEVEIYSDDAHIETICVVSLEDAERLTDLVSGFGMDTKYAEV